MVQAVLYKEHVNAQILHEDSLFDEIGEIEMSRRHAARKRASLSTFASTSASDIPYFTCFIPQPKDHVLYVSQAPPFFLFFCEVLLPVTVLSVLHWMIWLSHVP